MKFALSDQYAQNFKVDKVDYFDKQLEIEGGNRQKNRCSKKKKSTYKKLNLNKKRNTLSTTAHKAELAPNPISGDAEAYKPGEFSQARKGYICKFLADLKATGVKASKRQGSEAWNASLERATFLAYVSVPELKRRKFLPKGATSNPFLAQVQSAAKQ